MQIILVIQPNLECLAYYYGMKCHACYVYLFNFAFLRFHNIQHFKPAFQQTTYYGRISSGLIFLLSAEAATGSLKPATWLKEDSV